MKNIKRLFVLLLLLVLVPLAVYAEKESKNSKETVDSSETTAETTGAPEKINIYLFRGEGCPHCADLEAFFESIEKEYGKYYNIIDYEVWYNKENSELMNEVADKLGETAKGVPYLIIGRKTWNGYENDKSLNEEIKKAIVDEYNSAERFDVMAGKEKKNNAGAIVLVICIVVSGCALLYLSRRSTENVNDVPVEEEVEEVKVEKVVEEKKEVKKEAKKEEKKEAPKKTSSKKKSTKKKSNKK